MVVVTSLAIAGSAALRAGSRQEFAVSPCADDQEAPDIHGTIVVWQEFVAEYGDYDICVADINSPDDALLVVIGDANDQMNPAVFENIVVWQDYVFWQGSADWDIRLADISDPMNTQVFAVSDMVDINEQEPAIHGDTVVWKDIMDGNADIWAAEIIDLSNPVVFPVATFELEQGSPAVFRSLVVWEDAYYGHWDIFAADIWQRSRPRDFPVSTFEKNQRRPAISGKTVVWQNDYYGNWDIYVADVTDLSNPVELRITSDPADQMSADIDNGIIVWQDYRNNNWDIYGYNLVTGRRFQITDDPGDQINPAVSGSVVVWQDNRSGSWDIYAAELKPLESARCFSKLKGDLNGDCRVDFADMALMASRWLDCSLQPSQACPLGSAAAVPLSGPLQDARSE